MDVKIKVFEDYCIPTQSHEREWFDLKSKIDIVMRKECYYDIPLGVAIELPPGYEAIVAVRSSFFKNYLAFPVNGIGVIDNLYCGDNDEWHLLVFSLGDFTLLKAGDRIAQFRIQKQQPQIEFKIVTQLPNKDRGGIGSTGN